MTKAEFDYEMDVQSELIKVAIPRWLAVDRFDPGRMPSDIVQQKRNWYMETKGLRPWDAAVRAIADVAVILGRGEHAEIVAGCERQRPQREAYLKKNAKEFAEAEEFIRLSMCPVKPKP
jgi:hypothetical protein